MRDSMSNTLPNQPEFQGVPTPEQERKQIIDASVEDLKALAAYILEQ